LTILRRGGTNGKFVWSGRAFEERTEQNAARSPTFYRRTCGFGKLNFERAAHIVSLGSEADRPCTEKAVGTGSKEIEASEAVTGAAPAKRTF
jgi:hypothetical protein